MSDNNITTITNEDGQETPVNFYYYEDERPALNDIAFFTVYKEVEYMGWDDEGWISSSELEAIFTIPFVYTEETLKLMIEANKDKILELMNENEIFVGIEKHYGQFSFTL